MLVHKLWAPRRHYRRRDFCLIADIEGSTAVEYAVALALIVVAMLFSVQAVGSRSSELFRAVASEMSSGSAAQANAAAIPTNSMTGGEAVPLATGTKK